MTKYTSLRQICSILIVLCIQISVTQAKTITASTSGNWNSPATWGNNTIPTASDDVIISNSATVNLNIPNATCLSLTIGQKNRPGKLLFVSSTSMLTVITNVTLGNNQGNQKGTGSIDMSTNGGTLQIGGTITAPNMGTFTPGTGTIEYNGSGDQTILSTSVLKSSYYNLTVSNGGTKTLGANVTVAGTLTINAGNITVPSAYNLTVSGPTILNANECLVLKSDASGTGTFIDNGTITGTGTARVERYLTTAAWHYISSPIGNALSGVFYHDYIRTSDPTSPSGWGSYITPTDSPLQVMRGYSCWKPTSNPGLTEIFTGNLNTGVISFTGNRTATDPYAGWHLVGNPYPSNIDLTNGISWDQFEPTAYFWHQGESGGSYTNGNYDAYPAKSGFGTHSPYAPSMQGFYVHIKNAFTGNSTLSITNTSRVSNAAIFLKESPALTDGLLITATGNQNDYSDKITVHFDPEATEEYDPGYDAYKLGGNSAAPQLYTKAGEDKLTCNALPFSQENMNIPMSFYCSLPGQYTLTADSISTFATTISIFLEDLKLNSSQDLRKNPAYTFVYDTADNADRFVLHFSETNFGVQELKGSNGLQVYSWLDAIYVKSNETKIHGDLFVYNLLGKEMYHSELRNDPVSHYVPGLPQGYYVVKVVTDNATTNQKVFLK